MIEITLLSILVGGLANLMREQGGLSWLLRQIRSLPQPPRPAHWGNRYCLVKRTENLFIANNTVSILISGSVAKELAQTHQVSPARSASLLDIFALCGARATALWCADFIGGVFGGDSTFVGGG